jgi:cysteine-rich repeat protein
MRSFLGLAALVLAASACSLTVPDPPERGTASTTGSGGSGVGGGEGGQGGSPPACGDGLVAQGEPCDDGNDVAGDGCDAACAEEAGYACSGEPSACAAVCGDGLLRGSEVCDDANLKAGDGCDGACAGEPGFDCTGEPSVCAAVCGDGLLRGDEGCDDGNASVGDGCDGCAVELGYVCSGEPSLCAATCGNGTLDPGEPCDDGNLLPSDGCGAGCSLELGFLCTGAPSACAPICGDGFVKGTESCDDGAALGGDGCSASCSVESGYTCVGFPSQCGAVCGDGLVRGSELCDDGGHAQGDGCASDCTLEYAYQCSGEPSACGTVCGDAAVGGAEACDDGNTADGDCCAASCASVPGCEIEQNDTASEATDFAANATLGVLYGFVSQPGDVDYYALTIPAGPKRSLVAEVVGGLAGTSCESGALDAWLSVFDATLDSRARDDDSGVEHCPRASTPSLDPGTYYVAVKASPFAPDLTFDYGLSVAWGTLGDGLVENGEECDDGNLVLGDGCDAQGRFEPVPEVEPNDLTTSATGPLVPPAVVKGQHGSLADVDLYRIELPTTADLRIEAWDYAGRGRCEQQAGSDTSLELLNAQGVVLASDEDGGPGLCPRLAPESDRALRGLAPGTYFLRSVAATTGTTVPVTYYQLLVDFDAACGDLLTQGYEECDGGPSCTASCTRIQSCGDGLLDAPESCDDGDAIPGDGCDVGCVLEASLTELEPNDTPSAADAASSSNPLLDLQSGAFLSGTLPTGSDVDLYRVLLPSTTTLALETWDDSGADCRSGLATIVSVRDAAGVTLLSDTAGAGAEACGALVGTFDAGTYYVAAQKNGIGAASSYTLGVRALADLGLESEPNFPVSLAIPLLGDEVFVRGTETGAGDLDAFAVTLTAGRSLRVELTEGGAETCESNEVDSRLWVYDATGALLATDDDSGRGLCSRLDGTGVSPDDAGLASLPAGTYYVVVGAASPASGDTTGVFDYRLAVSQRDPGCADCQGGP